MEFFTKRHIKDGEVARQLYRTLVYPSTRYFRWAVQIHQIKNCPVTVQNVDSAIKIWRKYLDALKVKTTWSKPNIVARDQMKFSIRDIADMPRSVFDCLYIFCKQNPFLLASKSKTLFHSCQSPYKPQISGNIPRIQGYI